MISQQSISYAIEILLMKGGLNLLLKTEILAKFLTSNGKATVAELADAPL